MAVYSTIPLSGSTNGRPVPIVGTSSPGTLLHTVATATAIKEYPQIQISNYATTARQVTLEWGSTASSAQVVFTVPAQDGLYGISNGNMLVGATGQEIRCFATATDGVAAHGYVDRAT